MITKKNMEEDGFFGMDPEDQLSLRIYAEWLNERGQFQKAKLCWGQAALLDLIDHVKLGAFDQGSELDPSSDFVQMDQKLSRATVKRREQLSIAREMTRVLNIQNTLQVGDAVTYCEGISRVISPHSLHSMRVEAISDDGEMVTLNVVFIRRNRRCSTTAQVPISAIRNYHTPELEPERNGK